MFNDISKPAPPLPTAELLDLDPGVSLLPPLTRRGHGPGIIVLGPDADAKLTIAEGVPSHLVKWAEEGYTVVEIQQRALQHGASSTLQTAIEALEQCDQCQPKENIGLVSYDPDSWGLVAQTISANPKIAAVVIYANASQQGSIAAASVPTIHHLAGGGSERPHRSEGLTAYHYPGIDTYKFATPFQSSFHYNTEAVSHTRSLSLLKKHMNGPYFDLELIWEEHTYYEFADRSVEHTMSTMVQEPYVNHVPVLTGGVGRGPLTNFYRHNFIFNNSADTALELISRSIAVDRIIDEFIFKFTHDRELDWLLPGVPPTGLKAEVPFTAVVNIRGDRLYHEHIAWDQGTVLRQLGLMPEYLPYPYPMPDGRAPSEGNRFEYRVPVTGISTAQKMRDRNSEPSNELLEFKVREV